MKKKSNSAKLLNIIFMVSILLFGTIILAFGSVKVSADETSQEATVGANFVNTFNDNKFVESTSSISKKVTSWGIENTQTINDAEDYANTRSQSVVISKQPTVKTLTDKDGNTKYVAYYDVTGNNIEKGSYLSIFYNEDGKLTNTTMVMGVSSKLGVNAYIYGNGKQAFAAAMDNDGNVLSSSTNATTNLSSKHATGSQMMILAAKKKKKSKKSWLSCMSKCLSGMGVPTWILGAVGAACAVICIGTAGTACAACVSAVGAGYGTEVFHCAHYKC
jgi:hypothetical protein